MEPCPAQKLSALPSTATEYDLNMLRAGEWLDVSIPRFSRFRPLNVLGSRLRRALKLYLAIATFALCFSTRNFAATPPAYTSAIGQRSEIVFFPTLAARTQDTNIWRLEVRGCIWEEESRRVALGLLRDALRLDGIQLNQSQSALLEARARLFMVEQKAGKKIVVKLGSRTAVFDKSARSGLFSGFLLVNQNELSAVTNDLAQYQAVLPPHDPRKFAGTVHLWEPTGTTVISDIDDTIKDSRVRDRRALLRNTFLEPFRPVPGMAGLYQRWAATRGVEFCYVSASPWQLFTPLYAFNASNGFPAGVFYLKSFRWKDKSLLNLFESPQKYKPEIIAKLLAQFHKRQFVLVGDSGERDPEIYSAFARSNSNQIKIILIRNVTREPATSARYQQVFDKLPSKKWKVFDDPAELASIRLDD
jgi:phosphatidate phosphatase APP1